MVQCLLSSLFKLAKMGNAAVCKCEGLIHTVVKALFRSHIYSGTCGTQREGEVERTPFMTVQGHSLLTARDFSRHQSLWVPHS